MLYVECPSALDFMNRQKVTPQQWLDIANHRLREIPEVPCAVCYVTVDAWSDGSHTATADGLSDLANPAQRAVLSKLLKAIVDDVSLKYKIL